MSTVRLRHLVLFRFLPELADDEVASLVAAFLALPAHIPEVLSFEHGGNESPEGLDHGYTHAFTLGFADAASRDRYLAHPAHQAFVARVQPRLEQALVFDYTLR
ncbi:Dabb family protein [Chitinivorax sp. PXF-14]|uniref:Dabb family protein n=1 Tax=Chitinivorax sp. PXF-14 TaxID=3230488 RepID=UPI0034655185